MKTYHYYLLMVPLIIIYSAVIPDGPVWRELATLFTVVLLSGLSVTFGRHIERLRVQQGD